MSEKVTPAPFDVEAIRKRCEAASKPPWFYNGYDGRHYTVVYGEHRYSVCWGVSGTNFEGEKSWESDGQFIAHARTDLPAALAEIERLTEENATLSDELTQASLVVPTLELRVEKMRRALEHAIEWMAEDGCDCGTDEPGTCGLCEARVALTPEAKR